MLFDLMAMSVEKEKDVLQLRKMADFFLRLSLPLIRRPS